MDEERMQGREYKRVTKEYTQVTCTILKDASVPTAKSPKPGVSMSVTSITLRHTESKDHPSCTTTCHGHAHLLNDTTNNYSLAEFKTHLRIWQPDSMETYSCSHLAGLPSMGTAFNTRSCTAAISNIQSAIYNQQ